MSRAVHTAATCLDDPHCYSPEQIIEQLERLNPKQFDAAWVAMVLDLLIMEYDLIQGAGPMGRVLAMIRSRYRRIQETSDEREDKALKFAAELVVKRESVHGRKHCVDCGDLCDGVRCGECRATFRQDRSRARPRCVDCNCLISHGAKRCQQCQSGHQRKATTSREKKRVCCVCGKACNGLRCRECRSEHIRGRTLPSRSPASN